MDVQAPSEAKLCDRVAVMYAGQIVETGRTRDIFDRPRHPYTIGLLNCLPTLTPGRQPLTAIEGQPPDLATVPPGCSFAPRCPLAGPECERVRPRLEAVGPDHLVACLRAGDTVALASARVSAPTAMPAAPAPGSAAGEVVIEARGLTKHFPLHRGAVLGRTVGTIKAVDGVDFALRRGETLSLVGESGCGKTTTARLVLRLERPTAGGVFFRGRDIHGLRPDELGDYRRAVQAVFQDPYSSLNPRLTIRTTVGEPLVQNRPGLARAEVGERVAESLARVGLRPRIADDYPHELSGGQRQRVALARALTTNPECILLDEAVSALDVSIRAQVMNLLREIQDQLGVSYLFIAHDLAVVKYVSTRIGVMDADLFLIVRVFDPSGAELTFMGSTDPNTPITNGWLRVSHRRLDPRRSTPYRPYHPHDRVEPLTPGEVDECDVEILPTCIVVPAGWRVALTVRGKDYEYEGELGEFGKKFHYSTRGTGGMTHNDRDSRPPDVFGGTVTLHAGGGRESYLLVPIIPPRSGS